MGDDKSSNAKNKFFQANTIFEERESALKESIKTLEQKIQSAEMLGQDTSEAKKELRSLKKELRWNDMDKAETHKQFQNEAGFGATTHVATDTDSHKPKNTSRMREAQAERGNVQTADNSVNDAQRMDSLFSNDTMSEPFENPKPQSPFRSAKVSDSSASSPFRSKELSETESKPFRSAEASEKKSESPFKREDEVVTDKSYKKGSRGFNKQSAMEDLAGALNTLDRLTPDDGSLQSSSGHSAVSVVAAGARVFGGISAPEKSLITGANKIRRKKDARDDADSLSEGFRREPNANEGDESSREMFREEPSMVEALADADSGGIRDESPISEGIRRQPRQDTAPGEVTSETASRKPTVQAKHNVAESGRDNNDDLRNVFRREADKGDVTLRDGFRREPSMAEVSTDTFTGTTSKRQTVRANQKKNTPKDNVQANSQAQASDTVRKEPQKGDAVPNNNVSDNNATEQRGTAPRMRVGDTAPDAVRGGVPTTEVINRQSHRNTVSGGATSETVARKPTVQARQGGAEVGRDDNDVLRDGFRREPNRANKPRTPSGAPPVSPNEKKGFLSRTAGGVKDGVVAVAGVGTRTVGELTNMTMNHFHGEVSVGEANSTQTGAAHYVERHLERGIRRTPSAIASTARKLKNAPAALREYSRKSSMIKDVNAQTKAGIKGISGSALSPEEKAKKLKALRRKQAAKIRKLKGVGRFGRPGQILKALNNKFGTGMIVRGFKVIGAKIVLLLKVLLGLFIFGVIMMSFTMCSGILAGITGGEIANELEDMDGYIDWDEEDIPDEAFNLLTLSFLVYMASQRPPFVAFEASPTAVASSLNANVMPNINPPPVAPPGTVAQPLWSNITTSGEWFLPALSADHWTTLNNVLMTNFLIDPATGEMLDPPTFTEAQMQTAFEEIFSSLHTIQGSASVNLVTPPGYWVIDSWTDADGNSHSESIWVQPPDEAHFTLTWNITQNSMATATAQIMSTWTPAQQAFYNSLS